MQPYNFATPGGYSRTTTNGSGTSTLWVETYARRRSLSCASQKGDYKSPTPFSFTKSEDGYCQGSAGMYGPGWSIIETGYGAGSGASVTPGNSFSTNADDPYNKCLGRLYDQIRRDVDLSIDLYQGNQTLRMVKDFRNAILHPVGAAVTASRRFIGKNKVVATSKLAGEKWLQWQYGVRPTYQSIYDLTHELIGALSKPGGIQVITARASSKKTLTRTVAAQGNYWHSVVPAVVSEDHSRRCEIGLSYTIGYEHRNALSQFTSLNPASFVYENIPYSFVLDWFIDIGGYLRMIETALLTGLSFRSGYITRTTKRISTVVVNGSTTISGTTYTANLNGSCLEKSLDRQVLSNMPIPVFPSIRPNLGTERLLSAASLLTQFLSNPRRYK